MPSASKIFAAAAAVSQASAAYQGFNYGATFTNGAIKQQQDYENEFKAAQALAGTNGAFSSARIYTTVQGDTPSEPIAAIPAAIKTKTSLLMGLWASAGDFAFNNEIIALQGAIKTYCSQGLGDLVAGISVGSEDLYRISPIGIAANENPGASPDTLVGYIKKVRSTIKGTCLSDAAVGHVDTWTAFVNGSNNAVIENSDWLGMDAYPYFENTKPNDISDGKSLLEAALGNTEGAAMGKPVWITETGWPVSGKTSGAAVASTKNAKAYWDEVGCPRFGQQNVWWYTLQDAAPDTPNPSFGLVQDLNGEPMFDLSCKDVSSGGSSGGSTTSKASHTSTKSSVPTTTSDSSSETTSTTSSEVTSDSGPSTTSDISSQTTSDATTATTSTTDTMSTETSSTETSSTSISSTETSSTAIAVTVTTTASDSVATTLATATPTGDTGSGSGSGSGSNSGSGSSPDSGSDSGTSTAPPPSTTSSASSGNLFSLGALGVALFVTFAMF